MCVAKVVAVELLLLLVLAHFAIVLSNLTDSDSVCLFEFDLRRQ